MRHAYLAILILSLAVCAAAAPVTRFPYDVEFMGSVSFSGSGVTNGLGTSAFSNATDFVGIGMFNNWTSTLAYFAQFGAWSNGITSGLQAWSRGVFLTNAAEFAAALSNALGAAAGLSNAVWAQGYGTGTLNAASLSGLATGTPIYSVSGLATGTPLYAIGSEYITNRGATVNGLPVTNGAVLTITSGTDFGTNAAFLAVSNLAAAGVSPSVASNITQAIMATGTAYRALTAGGLAIDNGNVRVTLVGDVLSIVTETNTVDLYVSATNPVGGVYQGPALGTIWTNYQANGAGAWLWPAVGGWQIDGLDDGASTDPRNSFQFSADNGEVYNVFAPLPRTASSAVYTGTFTLAWVTRSITNTYNLAASLTNIVVNGVTGTVASGVASVTIEAGEGGGDNLGSHVAVSNLNMGAYTVDLTTNVTVRWIGAGVTNTLTMQSTQAVFRIGGTDIYLRAQ